MEKVKILASGLDAHGYTEGFCKPSTTQNNDPLKRQASEGLNEVSQVQPSNKIRKQIDHDEAVSNSDLSDVGHKEDVLKEFPEPLKRLMSKLPPQFTVKHSNAIELFYISYSKARIHPDFDFEEKNEPVVATTKNEPIAATTKTKKGKYKGAMSKTWICTLYIDDLLVCSAENTSKMEAKRCCFAKALSMLFNPKLRVKNVNGVGDNGRKYTSELYVDINPHATNTVTRTENTSIEETLSSSPLTTFKMSNSNFVLVESSTHENPITTIMCSAARNKIGVDFDFSDGRVTHDGETGYLGTLKLGGKVVTHAISQEKKAVKRAVAEKAVKELKTFCFTVKTRFHEQENAQSNAVSMESIKTEEENSTKITSGIGMQLLKKMGWSGEGGLGKKEQGRVEPVMVQERSNREGFGTFIAKPSDINALKQMVKKFATGDREDDLVFSSELSSEQRKVLHTECRKFNLKSTSYGKDEDRYLIVSRKRDVHQLVEYIAKNGGETLQYILVPPHQEHS